MRSLALALLAAVAQSADAQTLTGRIIDAADSGAVAGAEVSVSDGPRTRSDGKGTYRITGLGAGGHVISVRMLGYAPFADTVNIPTGQPLTRDLYLTRVPRLLSQMNVRGRSLRVPSGYEDVYRRANASNGLLVTREQIDSINPRDVVALLNFIGPLRASPNRDSPDRLRSSRCQPMVPGANNGTQSITLFLNGAPIANQIAINEVLDHLAPSNIQAVEMYNGPTSVPSSFQPSCGVLAIWTRGR
jgi:hypothetical protein